MSEPIKTGGPIAASMFRTDDLLIPEGGVSFRDYFAAAALMGICASCRTASLGPTSDLANHAYQIADAMIQRKGAA